MKHQVFFFLSIFSFSLYSMDQAIVNEVNKLTGDQIRELLNLYCKVHPQFSNDINVKTCKTLSKITPLTFQNKMEILGKMQGFNRPGVVLVGDRFVEVERESYETNKSNDRVY